MKKTLTQCLPIKNDEIERVELVEDIKRLVDINMDFLESLDLNDEDELLEYSKSSVV